MEDGLSFRVIGLPTVFQFGLLLGTVSMVLHGLEPYLSPSLGFYLVAQAVLWQEVDKSRPAALECVGPSDALQNVVRVSISVLLVGAGRPGAEGRQKQARRPGGCRTV